MGKTMETELNKSSKQSKKKPDESASTKVIIRRLPPSFNEQDFLDKLSEIFPEGLPEFDYFKFCGFNLSFSPIPFCRAYINFKNSEDILKFKDTLDGFVFDDGKGIQYPVVVEFAPFQGVPKKARKRKDIKSGTIEKDSDYLSFLETLNQEVEPLPSAEFYLEQQEANKQMMKEAKLTTPLIEYIKMKRANGKSRMNSSRSSTSSNDKKRKGAKDDGKTSGKSSYRERTPRSQNENSKKTNERKEELRGGKKFEKDDAETKQGGTQTKNSSRAAERKENGGEKEEKERTSKERPGSAKVWKEKSQNDYSRPNSSSGRSSSSYRQNRRERAMKDSGIENKDKSKADRVSRQVEERTVQPFDKDAVRNKDRPAQAIYQPRPRFRDGDDTVPSNTGRPGNREQKDKQPVKNFRENSSREFRERRTNRAAPKQRTKANEANVTKE